MELIGKLEVKYDTVTVSEKFKKRDFVLATDLNTPYPNFIQIQLAQDKCAMIDNYNIGDELKVQINITGRLWASPTGNKYFNTITAWRIEKVGNTPNAVNETSHSNSTQAQTPVFNNAVDDDDSLPF